MISIIGAGPAGNYAAYQLAKNGYDVNVFEEHAEIGKPVACTGIVTNAFSEIIKEKSFIINKINRIRIFSPNNEYVQFNLKKPDLIIDREKFDLYLAGIAEKEGVSFFLKHRFKGFENKNGKYLLKILNNKKIKTFGTDYIIGADGPNSEVAKSAGLYKDRKFFFGVQARVKVKNENIVETYLIKKGFAWVVPENQDTARVGLCSQEKDYNLVFTQFMKKRLGKNFKTKILSYQAGLIPIFNKNIKANKDNIFLIGDAATFVKAASAGGIVQGLFSAECVTESIIKNISYEKLWKKRLYKDLYYSLLIRRMLDKFKDKDYNFLVELFQQEKLKSVLEEYERDYPAKFALKLLLKEPRLLYFSKFLFE